MPTEPPSSGATPYSTFDESIISEGDPKETMVYPSSIVDEGHASDAASNERLMLGPCIGSGGFADVFSGHQGTLAREVAIKRIRDAHRPELMRVFTYEARITAGLNHPNIPPIHDLVVLEDQPVLLMKRVEGRSWDELLCAARKEGALDLAIEIQRLVDVCEAIAFAHSRGVLHLDIKPDNVMVGDFGEVLVMDWGCASLFDDHRWTNQPDLPRVRNLQRPRGTPLFMSPELARGEGKSIGPHTDVYLLGATLYTLLSDAPMRPGVTTQEVVVQAVNGFVEPLPTGTDQALAALCRSALAPDPAERLPTIDAFVTKLRRWLDTRESRALTERAMETLAELEVLRTLSATQQQEAVRILGVFEQAGRNGAGLAAALRGEHRTRRMLAKAALGSGEPGLARAFLAGLPESDVVRDRLLTQATALHHARIRAARASRVLRLSLAAAIVIIIGALGVVGSLWQEAETERIRATAVKDFSIKMVASVDPAFAKTLDSQLLLKVLEQAEVDAIESYADQPDVRAELWATLGRSYGHVGEFEAAERILREALALREQTFGENHPITATSVQDLASYYRNLGQYDESEALHHRALRILESDPGPLSPLTLRSVLEMANLQRDLGNFEDAEALALKVMERREEQLGPAHPDTLEAIHFLGWLYQTAGRLQESETITIRALLLRGQVLGPEHPETLRTAHSLAILYGEMGRYEEAERHYLRVLSLRESTLGASNLDTLNVANNLAILYLGQGRAAEAEPLLSRVRTAMEAALGSEHPNTLSVSTNLATSWIQLGRTDEAEALLRSGLAVRERTVGPLNQKSIISALALANLLIDTDQVSEAQPLLEAYMDHAESLLGVDHPTTLEGASFLALVYSRQGNTERALSIIEPTVSRLEATLGPSHPTTLMGLADHANIHIDAGDRSSAARILLAILERKTEDMGSAHPETLQAAAACLDNLAALSREDDHARLRDAVLKRAESALDGEAASPTQAQLLELLEADADPR